MRKITAAFMALVMMLCFLAGCDKAEDDEDAISENAYQPALSEADLNDVEITSDIEEMITYEPEEKEEIMDFKDKDSDIIPEYIIGYWTAYEIYQEARAGGYTTDEAMADEIEQGVYIGYNKFSTSAATIDNPVYKFTLVDLAALQSQGVEIDGIEEEFGTDAGVMALSVYAVGSEYPGAIVYFLDNQRMLYYGKSMFVFYASKAEAVG
ncbi:MAG: hypothetical protein LBL82_05550 [Oscillospiraceae bacterium]|jgi:hypothetical protein|nr:hypothetical protein [Oscillospiraceae bacterium]